METDKKNKVKVEPKKDEPKPISSKKINLLPELDISFEKRLQDRIVNQFPTRKQICNRKNRGLVMRIMQETYNQYKADFVNRLKQEEKGGQ